MNAPLCFASSFALLFFMLVCCSASSNALPYNSALEEHPKVQQLTSEVAQNQVLFQEHGILPALADTAITEDVDIPAPNSLLVLLPEIIAQIANILQPRSCITLLLSLPRKVRPKVLFFMNNFKNINTFVLAFLDMFRYTNSKELLSAMPTLGPHHDFWRRALCNLDTVSQVYEFVESAQNIESTAELAQNYQIAFLQLYYAEGDQLLALFNAHESMLVQGLPILVQNNTPQCLRLTVYSIALKSDYRYIPYLMKKYPLPVPDIAELLEPYANVASVYQIYSLDKVNTIIYQNVNDLLVAVSRLSNRDEYVNALIEQGFLGLAWNLKLLYTNTDKINALLGYMNTSMDSNFSIPYIKLIPKDVRLVAVTTLCDPHTSHEQNNMDGFIDMFERDLARILKSTMTVDFWWFVYLSIAAINWGKDVLQVIWVYASIIMATPCPASYFVSTGHVINELQPFLSTNEIKTDSLGDKVNMLKLLVRHWPDGASVLVDGVDTGFNFTFNISNVDEFYDGVAKTMLDYPEWSFEQSILAPMNEALSVRN